MDEIDVNERLRQIASRFFVPRTTTLLGAMSPPFDTSKPNLHDSKAAFMEEKRAVETAFEQAKGLLDFLMARYRSEDTGHEIARRLFEFVDVSTRQRVQRERPESVAEMVRKNAADAGLSYCLIFLLIDLVRDLSQRTRELQNQEAAFWSLSGRAPNYYARTIALRFAQLIARETGKMPTFGTSSDGGHPSTEFGRALEEIFEVLGIKANVRHPAKWAIKQLSQEDLKPEPTNHMGGIMGLGAALGGPHRKNALAAITDALTKGGER